MKIMQIQPNIVFTSRENKTKFDNKKKTEHNLSTTQKVASIGIGTACIALGSYFLLRGKSNFDKTGNKLIDKALKDFKPHFMEAKSRSVKKLSNNRTQVAYYGTNLDGMELKDNLIFDKDGNIQLRYLIESNPKTKHFLIKVYRGDKKILGKIKGLPNGEFDPNYFVKQFKRNPIMKEEHGSKEKYIYTQISETIKPDGIVTEYSKKYTPDLKINIMYVEKYKVNTRIDKHENHDFDWKSKTKTDAYINKYKFNQDGSLFAFAQQNTLKDGEWLHDSRGYVRLKYCGKPETKTFPTFNAMYAREKELGQAPNVDIVISQANLDYMKGKA